MKYDSENKFVQYCIKNNKYKISNHAWERMFTRNIKIEDMENIIINGSIVEIDMRNKNPRMVYNLDDHNAVIEIDMPSQCILITVEKVDWTLWKRLPNGLIERSK